jgi:predicted phosphoribosyltransferase
MGDPEPENPAGRTVIIVDDGVATGNTLLATIKILKKSGPARIVIAAPVMSLSAYNRLQTEADEVVALLVPEIFHGVGLFYNDFTQVTDEEVMDCIIKLHQPRHAQ